MSRTCPPLCKTLRILKYPGPRQLSWTGCNLWENQLNVAITDKAWRLSSPTVSPLWRRYTSTLDTSQSTHSQEHVHVDIATDTSSDTHDLPRSPDLSTILRKIPSARESGTVSKDKPSGLRLKIPTLTGEWIFRTVLGKRRQICTRPWAAHMEDSGGDDYSRLSDEIKAFESYMRPSPAEEMSFQLSIKAMRRIIANALPSHTFSLHGSRSTGIASPFSDIDISVCPTDPEMDYLRENTSISLHERKFAAVGILKVLKKKLDSSHRFHHNDIIHAGVPVLSSMDMQTRLVHQIQTLFPVSPSREWSLKYLSEYPNLRPLYVLLRHALLIRGLTSVHHGGLGSYSLLMMIAFALRFAPNENLGSQLRHVLDFWNRQTLLHYAYGVDCVSWKSYEPSPVIEVSDDPYVQGLEVIRRVDVDQPWLLCLQDPGNPLNDLGKRCFRINEIKSLLTGACGQLFALFQEHGPASDGLKSKGFLHRLVNAEYYHFEARREKLAKAGELLSAFQRDGRVGNSDQTWNQMLDTGSIYHKA